MKKKHKIHPNSLKALKKHGGQGRKPLPEAERRSVRIGHIYFTTSEAEKVRRRMEELGSSSGQYFRDLALADMDGSIKCRAKSQ